MSKQVITRKEIISQAVKPWWWAGIIGLAGVFIVGSIILIGVLLGETKVLNSPLQFFMFIFVVYAFYCFVQMFLLVLSVAVAYLTCEEDVCVHKPSDETTVNHMNPPLELELNGWQNIVKSMYNTINERDIVYCILSQHYNRPLAIFPKKLWDIPPDITILSRVAEEDTLVYQRKITDNSMLLENIFKQ